MKKHLKIVHANDKSLNTPKESNKETNTNLKFLSVNSTNRDALLGAPILNDMLTDGFESTNLLSQSQFEIGLPNQNMLLEVENLNVENIFNENERDLDHFNFEIDENKEQFICDICLKEFSRLKLLILHLNKHTGKYLCHSCHKVSIKLLHSIIHNVK